MPCFLMWQKSLRIMRHLAKFLLKKNKKKPQWFLYFTDTNGLFSLWSKTSILKNLTHLAEVISKSCGRWCYSKIPRCFRGVLICVYDSPDSHVSLGQTIYKYFWVVDYWMEVVLSLFRCCMSVFFFHSTGTLRMFLLGMWGGVQGGQFSASSGAKGNKSERSPQQCTYICVCALPPLAPFNAGS